MANRYPLLYGVANALLKANQLVLSGAEYIIAPGVVTPAAHAATHAAAGTDPVTLSKSQVGLSNVDNTSDVNKPVSTAQAAADALRVLKAGDTMTGALVVQMPEAVAYIDSTTTSLGAYFVLRSNGTLIGSFQAGGTTMAAPYTDRMRIRAYRAAGGIDFAAGGSATAQVSVEPSGELRALYNLLVGSSGTALSQVRVYAPNLTPANVAANTTAEEAFTVTGLTTADKVVVNVPGLAAGIGLVGYRVSAADTLSLTFGNFTGGPLAPPAGVYPVIAFRS